MEEGLSAYRSDVARDDNANERHEHGANGERTVPQTPAGLETPKLFFSGLRALVVGAFFTSPEGMRDLGYIGNTPIYGDYPGPTPEAMVHLESLVENLGLSL